LSVDSYQITAFPDGRTIVSGTDDVSVARTLQAKYIGS
jgi:adenylyltransferase/sulfurtransferase